MLLLQSDLADKINIFVQKPTNQSIKFIQNYVKQKLNRSYVSKSLTVSSATGCKFCGRDTQHSCYKCKAICCNVCLGFPNQPESALRQICNTANKPAIKKHKLNSNQIDSIPVSNSKEIHELLNSPNNSQHRNILYQIISIPQQWTANSLFTQMTAFKSSQSEKSHYQNLIDTVIDDLKRLKIIQIQVHTGQIILTSNGKHIAGKIVEKENNEAISQKRLQFDPLLMGTGIRRVDIYGDGACLFRSIARIALKDESLHLIFRRLSIGFMCCNKKFFENRFNANKEIDATDVDGFEFKTFSDWLNSNQNPSHYDRYGAFHFIALGMCLGINIFVFNKHNVLIYPLPSFQEHSLQAIMLLAGERHNFATVRIVQLGGAL